MNNENIDITEKVAALAQYLNEQRVSTKELRTWSEDSIDLAIERFPEGAETLDTFLHTFAEMHADSADITAIYETKSLMHILTAKYDYGCMEILLGRALGYIACNQWGDHHYTTMKPKEYLIEFMSKLKLQPMAKIVLLQSAVGLIKEDSIRGDHTLFIDGEFLEACGIVELQ